MGSDLGKKVDSLCEVLLLRNLPEGDRKTVCSQLTRRMIYGKYTECKLFCSAVTARGE